MTCIKYVLTLKSTGDLILHLSFYPLIALRTRPLGTGDAQPYFVPCSSISAFTVTPPASLKPGWVCLPMLQTPSLQFVDVPHLAASTAFPGCSPADLLQNAKPRMALQTGARASLASVGLRLIFNS